MFPTPLFVLPLSRCHLRLLISSQVAAVKTSLIKSNLRRALSFSRHCTAAAADFRCSRCTYWLARQTLLQTFPPSWTSGFLVSVLVFLHCANFPVVVSVKFFFFFSACSSEKKVEALPVSFKKTGALWLGYIH